MGRIILCPFSWINTFLTALAMLWHYLNISIWIFVWEHFFVRKVILLIHLVCWSLRLYSTKTVPEELFKFRKLIFGQFIYIVFLNFNIFRPYITQLSLKPIHSILFRWWFIRQIISSCRFHTTSLRIIRWSRLHCRSWRMLATHRTIALYRMWSLWHFWLCETPRYALLRLIRF